PGVWRCRRLPTPPRPRLRRQTTPPAVGHVVWHWPRTAPAPGASAGPPDRVAPLSWESSLLPHCARFAWPARPLPARTIQAEGVLGDVQADRAARAVVAVYRDAVGLAGDGVERNRAGRGAICGVVVIAGDAGERGDGVSGVHAQQRVEVAAVGVDADFL